MKIHGHEKRRDWIKVLVAVDPKTQELIAIEVTDDKVADSTVFPSLIEKSPKRVRTINADGGYDRSTCRKHLYDKGLQGSIARRRYVKIREEIELGERNDSLQIIRNLGMMKNLFPFGKSL